MTGFFKNGLCTVRGAATRWRNFTRDISGAFVSLFKSAKEATLPDLSPEQEPIVTVMESADEHLPAGARMTLSEAETRMEAINQEYWNTDEPSSPVKVAIDYMLDGEVDRYWLPLSTGPGYGSMLEQMQDLVENNLACLIFSAFMSSGTPVVDTTLSAVTMSWQYIGETIFNMLVLVGLVKGAERIVREMFGL